MTSEEITAIHDEYSAKFAHKLNAFYQLRSLFAPLIEGLILLDRLTFLRHQVRFAPKVFQTCVKVNFMQRLEMSHEVFTLFTNIFRVNFN